MLRLKDLESPNAGGCNLLWIVDLEMMVVFAHFLLVFPSSRNGSVLEAIGRDWRMHVAGGKTGV